MSRYLLDTDSITLIQYGHAAIIHRLGLSLDAEVAISALSIQEQMRGWLARLSRLSKTSELADWYSFLVQRMFPVWRRYVLLPVAEQAILRFEQLKALRANVGLMDLRIAAVALEYGMILVTRNLRDFGRVPSLVCEDWSV